MGIKYLDRVTGEIKVFNEGTIDNFIDFNKFDNLMNRTDDSKESISTFILNRVKFELYYRNGYFLFDSFVNVSEDYSDSEWVVNNMNRRLISLRMHRDITKEEIVQVILDAFKEIKRFSMFCISDKEYSFKTLFEKMEAEVFTTKSYSSLEPETLYETIWAPRNASFTYSNTTTSGNNSHIERNITSATAHSSETPFGHLINTPYEYFNSWNVEDELSNALGRATTSSERVSTF